MSIRLEHDHTLADAALEQRRKQRIAFWSLTALVIAGAVVVALGIYQKHKTDAQIIHNSFITEQRALTQDVRTRVESAFTQLYKGLRTIARLPGLRSIQNDHLEENADSSIQELYNNLASSVALSEVYIVGADMDPDKIDPRTGRKGAPLKMFDRLIVGQSATPQASRSSTIPEDESHEYRLIKKQLDHFKRRWSDEHIIAGLDYPALSGEEVITCDNTRYNGETPDDRDRMGMVYSVPFYSREGLFRGTVTGIILSHAIRDLMPSGRYVLLNRKHGYVIEPREPGAWRGSQEAYRSGHADPNLAYSEISSLNVIDDASEWALWSGVGYDEFMQLPEIRAESRFIYLSYTATVVVALLIIFALAVQYRSRARLAMYNVELENRVRERTHDLDVARERAEEATRAKSAFLATMSHEIRTPMNGVVGMAQALQNTSLTPVQRRYTDTLTAASSSLITMLNDLLDISKIEAGKMDIENIALNVKRVLQEVIDLMMPRAEEKELTLTLEIAPDVPSAVLGDGNRLRQIVINVVSNAIKFTHRGSIALRCNCTYRDGDTVLLKFSVTDTGIGIEPDAQKRLFQPFTQGDASTTRRYGGTGLGLAICKRLAELMNGRMGLESTPGVGSTFWVELPLTVTQDTDTRNDNNAANSPEIDLPHAIGAARILVVDDVEFNRDVIDALLVGAPAEIDFCDNGPEAVEQARKTNYDIILMDCQMPTMDGFEATRLIREIEVDQEHHAAIIALTANAASQDRDDCLAAGMDDYLAKPVDQQRLFRVLEKWTPAEKRQRPTVASSKTTTTPPSAPPQPNSIDLGYIRDLERELDSEFERVLRTFAADMQKLMLKLQQAQQLNDRREIMRVLHSVKGVSAYLGASRLSALAEKISLRHKTNDRGFTHDELQSLVDEHLHVREKLTELYGERWARAANLIEASPRK